MYRVARDSSIPLNVLSLFGETVEIGNSESFGFVANGIDSFEVAKMAGTSTEMIDQHYGHLRHDRMRAKLDAIAII